MADRFSIVNLIFKTLHLIIVLSLIQLILHSNSSCCPTCSYNSINSITTSSSGIQSYWSYFILEVRDSEMLEVAVLDWLGSTFCDIQNISMYPLIYLFKYPCVIFFFDSYVRMDIKWIYHAANDGWLFPMNTAVAVQYLTFSWLPTCCCCHWTSQPTPPALPSGKLSRIDQRGTSPQHLHHRRQFREKQWLV